MREQNNYLAMLLANGTILNGVPSRCFADFPLQLTIEGFFADRIYGSYPFDGLANGSYVVTPCKTLYSFFPGAKTVTVNGISVSAVKECKP